MFLKRIERPSGAFVKFAEKFDILQTVRMHVGAQQIDCQIQRMSDNKYNDKTDDAENAGSKHTAHLIDDLSDNSCRKSQRQQT